MSLTSNIHLLIIFSTFACLIFSQAAENELLFPDPQTDVCSDGVRQVIVQIPHLSLSGPKLVKLYLWYPSSFPSASPIHLAFLLAGALVRAIDYAGYATHLSKVHGYVVAIPEYTTREFPVRSEIRKAIDKSIANGYPCSPNGVFSSAKLLDSVHEYFRSISFSYDHLILIGPSFGGAVAIASVLGSCDFGDSDLLPLFCEGFSLKLSSASLGKLRGVVLFESMIIDELALQTVKGIQLLYVVSPTPFWQQQAKKFRQVMQDGQQKVVQVNLTKNTNHFMLNDYTTQTNGRMTLCAGNSNVSVPPFSTTFEVQSKVVNDCAALTAMALHAFQNGNPKDIQQTATNLLVWTPPGQTCEM